MKIHCLPLVAVAALTGSPCARHAETLAGAAARKSPQTDAFLAYEKAIIGGGIDAAKPWMTPAKVADLEAMVAAFGPAGFEEFRGRMRAGAQGEARRKQIEKVAIDGDRAVLEARDDPHAVSVGHLLRTKDGWKIDVRPRE
jgi:hypothetical protein